MVTRGMKPDDNSYHHTIPAYHSIISNGLDLLEKQLGIPYEESAEAQMEEQQLQLRREEELKEFTYYTPQQTREYLEERGLLHQLRGTSYKFESEEQSSSDA